MDKHEKIKFIVVKTFKRKDENDLATFGSFTIP